MALLDIFRKKKKEEAEIIPVFPEEIYRAGVLELRDIIAPAALEITANHVRLGEKLARVIFVFSLPRFLSD